MTGSSCPTSASTFWKKTIQGEILCDQSTCFDSSSCSRKLPAVWKNFFGTIGGRSRAPAERHPLAGLGGAAALEPLAHRRHVEHDDLVALDATHASLVERHEPSHATTSSAFRSGGKTG